MSRDVRIRARARAREHGMNATVGDRLDSSLVTRVGNAFTTFKEQ